MEQKGDKDVILVENQGGRGKGLIAARDFAKGDIVAKFSKRFVPWKEGKKPSTEEMKYRYDACESLGSYYHDDNEFGHFINDCADAKTIAAIKESMTVDACEDWADRYLSLLARLVAQEALTGSSAVQPNVNFHEPDGPGGGLVLCALRDVKKGEDLMTAYGPDYWIGRVSLDPEARPLTRMACVAWALRQLVYPTFGYVNALPAVLFPVRAGEATQMMALSMIGTDVDAARTATTGKAADELCGRWLKLLGLTSFTFDAEGWRLACECVGLIDVDISGRDSEE